jgi:hypothetical protein
LRNPRRLIAWHAKAGYRAANTENVMDEQKFEGEMLKAIMRRATQPERASYWKGVERGLQRAHFGAAFGTDDYHRFWLSLAENGGDESHREYGRGYRDGLALAALDATVPTASIDQRDDQAQLPLIDL